MCFMFNRDFSGSSESILHQLVAKEKEVQKQNV